MRSIEAVSGVVYRVEEESLPGGSTRAELYRCRDERGVTRLYTEYPAPIGDQATVDRAAELCARGQDLVGRAPAHDVPADSIAWPLDVVRAAGSGLAGVVLPLVPRAFYAPDGTTRTLDRLVRPSAEPADAAVRVRVLVRMCEVFQYLGSEGLIHGALSPEHLLWHGDEAGAAGVYVTGTDGLQSVGTPARAHRGEYPDWRDPRLASGLIEAPDEYSDRYALACALHYGLFLDEDVPKYRPGDGSGGGYRLPDKLAPRLAAMFRRTFDGPQAAETWPEAVQWCDALVAVYLEAGEQRAAQIAQIEVKTPAPAPISAPAPTPAPAPVAPPVVAPTWVPARNPAAPISRPTPSGPAPSSTTPSLAARRRARRGWILVGCFVGVIALVMIVLAVKPSTSSAAPYSDPGTSGYGSYGDAGTASATTDGSTSDDTGASATPTASASSTDDSAQAQTQAEAIFQLLTQSVQDRNLVANAVETELGGCQNIAQGVTDLNQAAADRASEDGSAQQFAVDALTGGDQLKQALLDALSSSQQADEAYARWGGSLDPATCQVPAPQNADFAAGDVASKAADAAKTQFIALWRPIAALYGLPVPDQSAI